MHIIKNIFISTLLVSCCCVQEALPMQKIKTVVNTLKKIKPSTYGKVAFATSATSFVGYNAYKKLDRWLDEDIARKEKEVREKYKILQKLQAEKKLAQEEMTSIKKDPLVTISSWKDVKPFAGRIVAYESESYYLDAFPNKVYPLNSKPSLTYGYVDTEPSNWSCGEVGYGVTRLLIPKAIAGNCAFIDPAIRGKHVKMRLATPKELAQISKAICFNKAKFEYVYDKKEAYAMLTISLIKFIKS